MKGFKQLSGVMAVSVMLIYIALVLQFRNAVKPFLVFAAIPYGMTERSPVSSSWVSHSDSWASWE